MTGPVTAVTTHFCLNLIQPILSVARLPEDDKDADNSPDLVCTIMLTIIYVIIYSISMVVCEVNTDISDNSFLLIMVKYVFGTCHHSLVPLIIIATREDIRDLIKVLFNPTICAKELNLSRHFPIRPIIL